VEGFIVEWPSADRAGFLVFYQDPRDGSVVQPEDGVYLDLPAIQERMKDVLSHPELNFFGVVDQFGAVLQFAGLGSAVRVEVPDPKRKGSMTKDATLEEGLALVRGAGRSLAELEIPGMEFETWG
jgi:hypothetical protein